LIKRTGSPALALSVPGTCPAEPVAGDLYDVFTLPGEQTALAVLNVSGRQDLPAHGWHVEAEVQGRSLRLAGLASLPDRTVSQSLHEQTRAAIQAVTPRNGDRRKDDMTILAFQREPAGNGMRV
jgi:serine phosphatase RsbU (regulator of sigma subunit)